MALILVSEYLGSGIKATVSRRHNDFVVVVYDSLQRARHSHPFNTQQQAEDYAEDCVIGNVDIDVSDVNLQLQSPT
jgi:hypothetical protein